MSYDLVIQSNNFHRLSVDTKALALMISGMDNIVPYSHRFFQFNVPAENLAAELYLEFIDADGIVVEWSDTDISNVTTNCIRLCIPYANMHDDDRSLQYFNLARTIARQLSWKVYDMQTGEVWDG
jgi:hypothetical protein